MHHCSLSWHFVRFAPMRTASIKQVPIDIARRVHDLSIDMEPEVFPPLDPGENLETTMRRREEQAFQYALCRRTWWRLTPEERSAIRATILEKDSHYRQHPENHGFEFACYDEIHRILTHNRQS